VGGILDHEEAADDGEDPAQKQKEPQKVDQRGLVLHEDGAVLELEPSVRGTAGLFFFFFEGFLVHGLSLSGRKGRHVKEECDHHEHGAQDLHDPDPHGGAGQSLLFEGVVLNVIGQVRLDHRVNERHGTRQVPGLENAGIGAEIAGRIRRDVQRHAAGVGKDALGELRVFAGEPLVESIGFRLLFRENADIGGRNFRSEIGKVFFIGDHRRKQDQCLDPCILFRKCKSRERIVSVTDEHQCARLLLFRDTVEPCFHGIRREILTDGIVRGNIESREHLPIVHLREDPVLIDKEHRRHAGIRIASFRQEKIK